MRTSFKVLACCVFLAAAPACNDGGPGAGDVQVIVSHLDVGDCPPGTHVITGTPASETITGTAGNDCIIGYGGDDTIEGGGGNDFIAGGDGNDTIRGGNGNDRLFGEGNDDAIEGGNGNDTVDGGDGNDTIAGDNGSDGIAGGAGNDIIDGGNGLDTITGDDGNDVIVDSRGADSTNGGAGTDACRGPACELPPLVSCDAATPCPDPAQACVGGACVYCQADSACDDSQVCNGAETCIPATGCQPGAPEPAGFDTGSACTAGVGACLAGGTMICDGAGASTCNAVPGTPTPDDVCDGVDDDCNGVVDDGDPDRDGVTVCADICPYERDETNSIADLVIGQVFCNAPGLPAPAPMRSFTIVTRFGITATDCTGRFVYALRPTDELEPVPTDVGFAYEGDVPGPAGSSSEMLVIDDGYVPWGNSIFHTGYSRTVNATLTTEPGGRRILTLDPFTLETSECELWRVGVKFIDDYQRLTHAGIQGGRIRYMRRAALDGDRVAFTPYDYVDLRSNLLDQWPGLGDRERMLFHEAGHIIRNYADGDSTEFTEDLHLYAYLRCHKGTEITREGYAFSEGWADYWSNARLLGHGATLTSYMMTPATTTSDYCDDGTIGPRGLLLTDDYVDWVEFMIADRLQMLADCVGDRVMIETLQAHPNEIHTLWNFENALGCATSGCCGLARTRTLVCPRGFEDEPATCERGGLVFGRDD